MNGTFTATQVDATHFSIPVNSSGLGAVTGTLVVQYQLFPQRPPRMVPYANYGGVRHRNVATSGVVETIHERVDAFLTFQMEWVRNTIDVQQWAFFMLNYAIPGSAFDYYPDYVGSSSTFTTYTDEDDNFLAAYKSLGEYTFSIKFRQRVAWP